MNDRYAKLAKILSEGELILLEDAMRKYTPPELTIKGQDIWDNLQSDIIDARRWAHHFGKTER